MNGGGDTPEPTTPILTSVKYRIGLSGEFVDWPDSDTTVNSGAVRIEFVGENLSPDVLEVYNYGVEPAAKINVNVANDGKSAYATANMIKNETIYGIVFKGSPYGGKIS